MAQKILVTGCCGQIGSRLVRRLSTGGAGLYGIDVAEPAGELALSVGNGRLHFIPHDLADGDGPAGLERELQDVDTLVHLVSTIEHSRDVLQDGTATLHSNSASLLNAVRAMPSLTHVCFASSMMVYGEPQSSPIGEDHPTFPVNLYGIAKLFNEGLLRTLHAQRSDVNVSLLRFTGLYGPGRYSGSTDRRAIPSFIRLAKQGRPPQVHAGRGERRDYLHVDDAVEAIAGTIDAPFTGAINVGSGTSISITELAETVCRLSGTGVRPEVREAGSGTEGRRLDYRLDISRARELIGFEPRIGIEEGIRRQIEGEV